MGSESANEPSNSPASSPGSTRFFCASEPASSSGSETSFTYAAISDTVPETLASSSTYAHHDTSLSQRPPCAFGTESPSRSCRAITP